VGSAPQASRESGHAFDASTDRYLAIAPVSNMDAWVLDRSAPTHVALLDLEPGDATNTLRADAH